MTSDDFRRGPRQTGRVVVSDDGYTIQVHAHDAPDGPPTVVLLPPLRCLQLAHELLAAGLRHLKAAQARAKRGPK